MFEKDKRVSEQIRDIGKDYGAVVASASQQNRGAVEETRIHQGHVAGGISKVNTSDVWISVHANATMRSQEECAFQLVKTRSSDGEGQMIYLKWTKNIRIMDMNGNKEGLTLKKKDTKPWIDEGEAPATNKGLLDLIDD